MFFPQCEKPSFKPIQNNMQNHSSVQSLILIDRKWEYKCFLAKWSRYFLHLQFIHRQFKYLCKLLFDEVPFLLSTNSGVHCTSCMQTNVDGCVAETTTARVDQHWLTLLHVPNHHQCIVSLSMTKWSKKYTFLYFIYIKSVGILSSSSAVCKARRISCSVRYLIV